MSDFVIVNILDLIESVGTDEVQDALMQFSCSRNSEIETFVRSNAVEFAKRKMSVTHLVMNADGQIAAYFTLAHKPSRIPANILSNSAKRKLERYARLDRDTNTFDVSAFLIAQFGKNDAVPSAITGDQMMEMVLGILSQVQHQVGGGVVFLECEDKKKLLDFYQNDQNRFILYGERYSKSDGISYKQLLRFF